MPPTRPCGICVDLWREYAEATRSHVELIKEQERLAGVNIERFQELEELIDRASLRRVAARDAVKLHLAAHEGRASRTAGGGAVE